jgi:hypothetical protein
VDLASNTALVAYGVLLLLVMVGGYALIAVLWYLMVHKPGKQARHEEERRDHLSGEREP